MKKIILFILFFRCFFTWAQTWQHYRSVADYSIESITVDSMLKLIDSNKNMSYKYLQADFFFKKEESNR